MAHNSAYYTGYSAELLAVADQMRHAPAADAYRKMAAEYAWMAQCMRQIEDGEFRVMAAADAAAA